VSFRELLAAEFRPYGDLSASQLEQLEEHYRLLVAWNRGLNLTRLTNLEEAVRLHYCESLFVGTTLPAGPLAVCDAGSGAGFPGIPLAIFRPDLDLTLLEADQRKAVFLREAARELKNVKVRVDRIEICSARFDWVLSRAVSSEELLSSSLAPNFALLTSIDRAPAGFEVIRLPWGSNRVLALGASVPRETTPQ